MLYNLDRAKQFLPMDALKGFREALEEKEKEVFKKIDLLEDSEAYLSWQLNLLKVNMWVTITYYKINTYQKISGWINKLNYTYKYLTINNEKIFFSDIIKIYIGE